MKTRKIEMSMHRIKIDFLKADGTLLQNKDVDVAQGHLFQLYYDGMFVDNALKIELPTLDASQPSPALAVVTVVDDPKAQKLLKMIKRLI
jgi:hypothetical protein